MIWAMRMNSLLESISKALAKRDLGAKELAQTVALEMSKAEDGLVERLRLEEAIEKACERIQSAVDAVNAAPDPSKMESTIGAVESTAKALIKFKVQLLENWSHPVMEDPVDLRAAKVHQAFLDARKTASSVACREAQICPPSLRWRRRGS